MTQKKWTPAKDAKWDKAHGVKPGSKKDKQLDKKRGIAIVIAITKKPRKGGK